MLDPIQAQNRWREYARTQSPRLRETLIRDYALLARRAVERLQISPWGCVSQDDLLSCAVVGLIDAVDRYNPEHGTPFEAFAMPRIRGAVLDSLRKLDWVPRSVRSDESRLRRAYGRLESILGRAPTDEEVAEELGVSPDELEGLLSDVARGSVLSLDDLVSGGSNDDDSHSVDPPDYSAVDPYQAQERGDARARLSEAIDALPEREKLVVSLYYYHELTLKEIGKVLRVTEQRVSQLHAKAMLRLSHKLTRHTDLLAAMAR